MDKFMNKTAPMMLGIMSVAILFLWPLLKGKALDKMLRSMDTDAKAIGVLHSAGMNTLSAQPMNRQIEFVYNSLILGSIEDIKTGK